MNRLSDFIGIKTIKEIIIGNSKISPKNRTIIN